MIPSPIKTKKEGNRRGTTAGKVQGVVVPVCASSKAAVAIDDLWDRLAQSEKG